MTAEDGHGAVADDPCHSMLTRAQKKRALYAVDLVRRWLPSDDTPLGTGEHIGFTDVRDPSGEMRVGYLQLTDGWFGLQVASETGPYAGRSTAVGHTRQPDRRLANMGDVRRLLDLWTTWIAQEPLDERGLEEIAALDRLAADAAVAAATRYSAAWTDVHFRTGRSPYAPSVGLCFGSVALTCFDGAAVSHRSPGAGRLSPALESLLTRAGVPRITAGGRSNYAVDIRIPHPDPVRNDLDAVGIMRAVAKANAEGWELI